MKWIKYAVVLFVLLLVDSPSLASSWDIGAVQLEGGATDIGAVQATAAAPAGVGQVIIIQMTKLSPLLLLLPFIWKRNSRKYRLKIGIESGDT